MSMISSLSKFMPKNKMDEDKQQKYLLYFFLIMTIIFIIVYSYCKLTDKH